MLPRVGPTASSTLSRGRPCDRTHNAVRGASEDRLPISPCLLETRTLRGMSDSTSPPAAASKRACDACHRRKVKCIGDGPKACKNCTSAGLSCTYNAIPQKKGPKGSRAKVISELRHHQRQANVAHPPDRFDDHPSPPPPSLRPAELLSADMITACVDYFFANLYPTQPILHRQKASETIGQMDRNIEAYCLVVSLCGYMMIQPNMEIPPHAFDGLSIRPRPSVQLGHALIRETLRVRRDFNYAENPTVWSVTTSFFLFGSFFCLDQHNTAWYHLREATTLAQILGMHHESHYHSPDWIENSRKRRLYWLLFVTERAYALQQHRPLTLYPTINPPTLDEDPTEAVELSGFIHLVNLFRPFDDTFVGLWNKTKSGCTADFLAQLQQQLSDGLPDYIHSTESQAVDLRCSQQWLRTVVWQLSIGHGFLSSSTSDTAMSFKFPIDISRDLVAATSHFSQAAMEVHGIGLIEKLFDVACTLTDVMACVPLEQHGFECGPRDYLNQLMLLISTLRGGRERYIPLLTAKISETVPSLPSSHGYSLPPAPRIVRFEELDDSQSGSDVTRSGGSTPLSDSPLDTAYAPLPGFPGTDSTVAPPPGRHAIPTMHRYPGPVLTSHCVTSDPLINFEPAG